LPAASTGGAFGAHPARFRVSHLGRSDHSAPQRADRVNFSEGTAGGTPAAPERNLGGRGGADFSLGAALSRPTPEAAIAD
jgi:hypothetical protein